MRHRCGTLRTGEPVEESAPQMPITASWRPRVAARFEHGALEHRRALRRKLALGRTGGSLSRLIGLELRTRAQVKLRIVSLHDPAKL